MDRMMKSVAGLTNLSVALLTLSIVVSLLVGPGNMMFLGNVVENIIGLISLLGGAGLVDMSCSSFGIDCSSNDILLWCSRRICYR